MDIYIALNRFQRRESPMNESRLVCSSRASGCADFDVSVKTGKRFLTEEVTTRSRQKVREDNGLQSQGHIFEISSNYRQDAAADSKKQ